MAPLEASLPKRIDRYELHDAIASGGMATVHVGRLIGPAGFGRTVAIKRLHPHLAQQTEFVTMLTDEARVTGRIGHPNIVPTLDVVASRGELFLVMEYVPGLTLAALLQNAAHQGERIPVPVACSIMAGVLRGLDAAHEVRDENGRPLEVVHRDVSPQNILVGADGIARLLDFGIAKAAGRLHTTRDGQLKGKLGYMAPEQLGARPVDRRSDIYAASVVLWEALCGERLFDGDDAAHVFGNIMQKKVPPPSTRREDLPPALDALVLCGLDREPGRRFARARDMAAAIESGASLARASEIAEWVAHMGEIELADRARVVAEMSRASAGTSSHSPVNDSSGGLTVAGEARGEAPPNRRTLRIAGMAALALGAAGILAMARGVMKSDAGAAPTGPASTAAVAAAPLDSATAARATTAGPLPAAETSLAAGDPAEGIDRVSSNPPAAAKAPTTARTGAAARAGAAKARPPKTTACDPPFTIDDMGHKHYKVDCL